MTQPIHPMLERVARAIADNPVNWRDYLAEARAAIQALLEPDEGMVLSGKESASFWTYIAEDVMRDAYRAMLLPLVEGDAG